MQLLCAEISVHVWDDVEYDYVVVDNSDVDDASKFRYLATLQFPGAVVLDHVDVNPGHSVGFSRAIRKGWKIGKSRGWRWVLFLNGNTVGLKRNSLDARLKYFVDNGHVCGWPLDGGITGCAYGLMSMDILDSTGVFLDPRWGSMPDNGNEVLLTELLKVYGIPCIDYSHSWGELTWHPRRDVILDLINRESIRGFYADQVRAGTERFLFHPARNPSRFYR